MYPGTLSQMETKARYEQQRVALSSLGDFAAQHQVLICVENVFYWQGTHSATPKELADELAIISHSNDLRPHLILAMLP